MAITIYLVTCKVTHARAIIAARSTTEAIRTHPTDALAWWDDGRGWRRGVRATWNGRERPTKRA